MTASLPPHVHEVFERFITTGIVRNPQYTTVLSPKLPVPIHKSDVLYTEIRSAIDGSSFLADNYTMTDKATGTLNNFRPAPSSHVAPRKRWPKPVRNDSSPESPSPC